MKETMTTNVAGIVFGAIFGLLFLVTCVISSIKAVKDRKRIKQRIEIKRQARLGNAGSENPENGFVRTPIEENNVVRENGNGSVQNVYKTRESSAHCSADVHKNVFRTASADDVITERAYNISSEMFDNSLTACNSYPELYKDSSLSKNCLAVQKQIRRTSYAIAVDTFSWLPKDSPKFAKTTRIMERYKHTPAISSISSKAYENRAFDPHDVH